eukprot:5913251-Alexandrium_andersonii.AAC.1
MDVRVEIERTETELQSVGKVMTGRQVLWVIGTFFRTKQECGGIYLINDLTSITLPNNANDAQLRRFYDLWMKIYQGQYDKS